MSRGDRQQIIHLEEVDRQDFLKTLAEACQKTGSQAKAERMIGEELRRWRWQEVDLASRRKRDRGKLAIAVRLRQQTTLPVRQIAARLHLGAPGSARVRLVASMKNTNANAPTQAWLGT